jgi:hypothetical protein
VTAVDRDHAFREHENGGAPDGGRRFVDARPKASEPQPQGSVMTSSEITTVPFHGATLIAVKGATPAETLVAMKPVAEGMGLSWQGQHAKLTEHPVLSKGIKDILIPSEGGPQAMTALPLSRLNFWLATIHPNKVLNLDTRAKIIRYQEECADVLFAHFFEKAGGDVSERTFGVARSTIHKVTKLERTVADLMSMVETLTSGVTTLTLAADGRVAALDLIAVRQLMDEAGAISKGRNSLNGRVRNALLSLALRENVKGVRRCPHSNHWLFPIDFAREFMASTGNAWVAAHNASLTPQGDLFATSPAKKRKAKTPQPANDARPTAANNNSRRKRGVA